MPITLSKGQQIVIHKPTDAPSNRIIMGLGWDARPAGFWRRLLGAEEEIDLDASCLMLDEAGQLVDTVWFRQLRSKDESVVHTGDSRTGGGDGDDEQIFVDLDRVPSHIKHLFFVVNSFTGQTFDRIDNAYCRLADMRTKQEIARYMLTNLGSYTAQIMVRLYRDKVDWRMQAIGEGSKGYTPAQLMPLIRRLIQ